LYDDILNGIIPIIVIILCVYRLGLDVCTVRPVLTEVTRDSTLHSLDTFGSKMLVCCPRTCCSNA